MKIKILVGSLLIIALGLAGIFAMGLHHELARRVTERVLNESQKDLFQGSLRLGKMHVNPQLKVRIENLRGQFQWGENVVPFEIAKIESRDPAFEMISKEGTLRFEGARLQDSPYEGMQGTLHLRKGREGFIEVNAQIAGVGLEEIRWLDPENLAGASGKLQGTFKVRQEAGGEIRLTGELHVDPPGGKIRGWLFVHLLPYLPHLRGDPRILEILNRGGLVDYRDASVTLETLGSDRMKVFVRLSVPDYNLVLNANIELRIDEEKGFLQLAQFMKAVKEQSQIE